MTPPSVVPFNFSGRPERRTVGDGFLRKLTKRHREGQKRAVPDFVRAAERPKMRFSLELFTITVREIQTQAPTSPSFYNMGPQPEQAHCVT